MNENKEADLNLKSTELQIVPLSQINGIYFLIIYYNVVIKYIHNYINNM